jgi:uncharacterized protein involved in exopolysaccharide biosynthesis
MGMYTESTAAGLPPELSPIKQLQEHGLKLNLDIARSVRMHRRAAISVGGFVLFCLLVIGLTRKPFYEAESLIYVQPIIPRAPTDATAGSYDSGRYDAYMQQQILTFDRSNILGHALDELPADLRSTFNADRTTAIRELRTSIKVERIPDSYEISVTAYSPNSAMVAPLANALSTAYLQNGQQDDLALNGQQLQSLIQERAAIQEELARDGQEQSRLSGELGVADTSGLNANPYDSQLADLRTKLSTARSAHDVAEAELASVRTKASQDAASDDLTRTDAELQALKTSLGSEQASLVADMTGMTPLNPRYAEDQAKLDKLKQQINNSTNDVKHQSGQTKERQLELEATRTGDIVTRLDADLRQQTAIATSGAPRLQQAQSLTESIRLLRARFADVDNAIHTLSLAQSPNFAAHVSLMAAPPDGPMPSRRLILLCLAIPVSILCGIGTAVILMKLDSRIYIGKDVERVLDFSPMAVLPQPGEVGYKVTEEFLFRLIAGLDQAHRVAGASTFILTACSQDTAFDDLVSSVAAELEILGYRTMILSAAEALSPVELTTKKSAFSEWHDTTELARSQPETGLRTRRESLVDEHLDRIKQKVDFLFVKAQPIRTSSETEFVIRLGDVTVLLVDSGTTTREELKGCLNLVRRLRARGLAAVVCDLKLRNADAEFLESVDFANRREEVSARPKTPEGMLTLGRR